MLGNGQSELKSFQHGDYIVTSLVSKSSKQLLSKASGHFIYLTYYCKILTFLCRNYLSCSLLTLNHLFEGDSELCKYSQSIRKKKLYPP